VRTQITHPNLIREKWMPTGIWTDVPMRTEIWIEGGPNPDPTTIAPLRSIIGLMRIREPSKPEGSGRRVEGDGAGEATGSTIRRIPA
jgi:hypothetical protein